MGKRMKKTTANSGVYAEPAKSRCWCSQKGENGPNKAKAKAKAKAQVPPSKAQLDAEEQKVAAEDEAEKAAQQAKETSRELAQKKKKENKTPKRLMESQDDTSCDSAQADLQRYRQKVKTLEEQVAKLKAQLKGSSSEDDMAVHAM